MRAKLEREGVFHGYRYLVVAMREGLGHRCGYICVPEGHPWYGKDYDAIPADIHGGVTRADRHVGVPGVGDESEGWWVGFDCAHAGDAFDPELRAEEVTLFPLLERDGHLWTVEDVENECRTLAVQAEQAAK